MKEHKKPIVGVTIGDMNGIGPEIILKVFSDARLLDLCTPVIYGSSQVLEFYKKNLHLPDLALQKIASAKALKKNKINVIDCHQDLLDIEPGKFTSSAGKLALDALEAAISDVKLKEIDVLVTAPINKRNVAEHIDGFTGHTGFLSIKDENKALMMLCSEKMKIAMVTGHVPISEVSQQISIENVIESIQALQRSLVKDFGIRKPKIAVLGLNPHAGEGGVIGSEEQKIILPAIDQVKTKGILAFGPYPPDGFFGTANYANFDAVLAMYHDQALIPFKTLSFENGVNYSSGLSFVRTSPDHGTAFEIAGTGQASEASLRTSIYYACDIFNKRAEEMTEVEAEEAVKT